MGEYYTPTVTVLIASYNGNRFIKEQLESILNQSLVNVKILVSDDRSTDDTQKIIQKFIKKYSNVSFIENKNNDGYPGVNFFNLIKNAPNDSDFYAFSDQDDIWFVSKLINAIKFLNLKKDYQGYSSDVITLKKNKKKYLVKNIDIPNQYSIYRTPGPGCTFVFKRSAFLNLHEFIENHKDLKIFFHDWFVYNFFINNNLKWISSSSADILYRQHNHNAHGANNSIFSLFSRIRDLFHGDWINEYNKLNQIIYSGKNPFSFSKLLLSRFIGKKKLELLSDKYTLIKNNFSCIFVYKDNNFDSYSILKKILKKDNLSDKKLFFIDQSKDGLNVKDKKIFEKYTKSFYYLRDIYKFNDEFYYNWILDISDSRFIINLNLINNTYADRLHIIIDYLMNGFDAVYPKCKFMFLYNKIILRPILLDRKAINYEYINSNNTNLRYVNKLNHAKFKKIKYVNF